MERKQLPKVLSDLDYVRGKFRRHSWVRLKGGSEGGGREKFHSRAQSRSG